MPAMPLAHFQNAERVRPGPDHSPRPGWFRLFSSNPAVQIPPRRGRARFIPLLLTVTAIMTFAPTTPAKEFLVFFGTYTNALSRGIYVSRLDAATGKLSPPELAAETPSPAFLAVSPDARFLYAANESERIVTSAPVHDGAVTAFAVDKSSGRLSLLNQVDSAGNSPCHVSVDRSGKVLFVANYGSGSVKAFLLAANGAIGPGGDFVSRAGHSVNPSRQASAHAHFICADPSNRFALSCDLGTDEVIVYPFDATTGGLLSSNASGFKVPGGSGPRHLVFSPDARFVHVINEMACTIATFAWDSKAGSLKLVETISALPAGVTVQPDFTAAEILTAGNHAYATIRGHDSVSVFEADALTGRLKLLQNLPAGGKVPRGLGIDPTGRWLLVGNQNTHNVVEFSIDPQTGELATTGQELKIGSPVDVKFITAFSPSIR